MNLTMSSFARNVMLQKYARSIKDGNKETWDDIAFRVVKYVTKPADLTVSIKKELTELIRTRKFIPGGRYLYAAGRDLHQVQNCLLLRAEDSREGWSQLLYKASMALMTGAGIGIDYSPIRAEGKPIRRTGGDATGPIALMKMINECGRGIQQGGSRRSAIWAGLNWKHADINKFMELKNWSTSVTQLKTEDFNFPATMDGTNISVQLDDDFFKAYNDDKHPNHTQAHSVYWTTVKQMLKTGEPGFSIDVGINKKETLRNAPVTLNTRVLTHEGYKFVHECTNNFARLWTGKQWSPPVKFVCTKRDATLVQVHLSNGRSITCDPEHPFLVKEYEGAGQRRKDIMHRVPAGELQDGDKIYSDLPMPPAENRCDVSYAYGLVYGDGSIFKGRGDISYHVESKKPCWELTTRALEAFCVKVDNRAYFGSRYQDKQSLLENINNSFVAGYFDADGSYTRGLLRLGSSNKENLLFVQEYLDTVGIQSIVREDGHSGYKPDSISYTLLVTAGSISRFKEIIPTIRLKIEEVTPYRTSEIRVERVEKLERREDVYCVDVQVEEHAFMAEGVLIANCTEITSEDDSDICNLGSINLARIESLEEMKKAVELATIFLLAGTLYSDVPYPEVDKVRSRNRRLGLGLMGIHEWLLARGKKYGPDPELDQYLEVYAESQKYATTWSNKWDLSTPVKTRAIAPTGSIAILAETTSGIEPIFCSAYKRRYLKGSTWHYQYVIDPITKNLVEKGIDPDTIEDAYTLSSDPERRLTFQAHLQQYVDHAISSTINLPAWGTDTNNEDTIKSFGNILMAILPKLRGITTYPDGSRGGQPLTAVKWGTAIKHENEVFVEQGDICAMSGKGGTCGS